MARYIGVLILSFFVTVTTSAQELPGSVLLDRYYRLFNLANPDSIDTFYKISAQLLEMAQQEGNMDRYYALLANEIVYEANNEQHFSAIEKANALIEDLKESHGKEAYYSYAYKALGSIFEQRGNNQMAKHYYEDALRYVPTGNHGEVSEQFRSLQHNLYSSLARVTIVMAPDEAWKWNECLKQYSKENPHYRKPYLSHKAQIYFYKGDWDGFLRTKRRYDEFVNTPESPQYYYGENKLDLMENVVTGNYEEALRQLDSLRLNHITKLDVSMRIHEIMGRQDLMREDAYRRIYLQDSLNNEVIYENLNALNVSLGMSKLQAESARERELWMWLFIGLMVLAFALLIWRYVTRYRYMKRIEQQNAKLEMAFAKAQESDRMKTSFIQLVSHEMRTPLNIITGFVQIFANSEYEVEPEDRDTMLRAIDENTVAITNIVNNLLEVSLESSKTQYERNDRIVIEDFCRYIMTMAEDRNHGRLELKYRNGLPDDFTIQSNKGGIEHIVRQVMGNSLKFTEQGYLELAVSEDSGGGNVRFVMADTGIGIPEELHDRVFEQFYKVDPFKQGLGIGLFLSRKIAALLGGTLVIDKNYHDGTRVILTIPVK